MKARIVNGSDFGGVHIQQWLDNNQNKIIAGQLVSEWTLTQVLPNEDIIEPEWNGLEWIESYIKVIEVPKSISRMKFIIQIYLTTQIKYEDIVLFITNLNFDEAQKYVILTRLRSATHFDRNSSDLGMIAQMMGITSEQLDEIFINGNLLN